LRDEIISPLAPRDEEEPMRMPSGDAKPAEKAGGATELPNDEGLLATDDSSGEKDTAFQRRERPGDPPSAPATPAPEHPAKEKPAAEHHESHPTMIDLEGFEGRAVVLPIEGGRFDHLCATAGKLIYVREPRVGSYGSPHPLCFYDIEKRSELHILDDVGAVRLSANGRKLLAERGKAWGIIDVLENQRIDRPLATSGLEATIDPAVEWRQLFDDAWRLERDFFYDPHMHGVDWKEMRGRYGELLKDCVTRSDVNYVLGEMIGELNCSHTYRGGGDYDAGPHRGVGYLGCDLALEQGAYRIKHILEVAPWDYANRPPLRQPGIAVKEGDWLLAVNGHRIDISEDPWAAFQGMAETTVQLTVNRTPTLEGARKVLVRTVGDESRMRQLAWVEANRRQVEKLSGGKAGYLYVRNTAVDGQNELYRQFRAQFNKPALVIDERWNSGGQVPDRFVELLARHVTNYWKVRDGHDWQTPFVAHTGPMAMLVNGWSGSGGDCLPWMFRKAGLGPVIGERTWGGLIGMTGAPQLIDGGHVTVPTFGIYDASGSWIIEGNGVEPDISVVDDPGLMASGADPQLERAVTEVMKSLEANPPAQPKHPEYPNRAGTAVNAPPVKAEEGKAAPAGGAVAAGQ
jgi:tricorn protease